jgi:hypothetical protein
LTGIDVVPAVAPVSGEQIEDGDKTLSSPLMTPEEFEGVQSRLGRMTLDTVRLAREVLVEGKSQVEVATANNLTRQRVSLAVNRIMKAASDIPADWQKVEVWLPPAMIEQVKQMEIEARQQATAAA